MFGNIKEICQNKYQPWPAPRSGHRICASENFLYLFGGYDPAEGKHNLYNELWRYNITTQQWIVLPDKEGLCPVECASSSMVLWRNKIIIFGGSGFPFAHTNSDKLLMYCLKEFKWIDLNKLAQDRAAKCIESDTNDITEVKECGCREIKFQKPSAKYGQSMNLYKGNKLLIFSGTAGRWFNNELHTFDLITFEWTQLELCEQHNEYAPSSRYRHEVVTYKNESLILGGAVLSKLFSFDDLHSFDVKNKLWKKHKCSSNVFMSTRHEEKACFPLPRKAHTCVSYEDKVYMIGGINGEEEFQDIWRLDLKDMYWIYLPKLTFPHKVYFHSAAVTSHGCMYVYGGINPEGSATRTTELYQMWLKAPSLREQCWFKVTNMLKMNKMLNKNVLTELGIPKTFLYRIDDTLAMPG